MSEMSEVEPKSGALLFYQTKFYCPLLSFSRFPLPPRINFILFHLDICNIINLRLWWISLNGETKLLQIFATEGVPLKRTE